MSFKDTLNLDSPVRFYTAADPYFYTVDNRPIEDLNHRDELLADELDRRIQIVDISGTTSVVNTIPTGWTLTKQGVGFYTITHGLNLDSTLVSVLVSCITADSPNLAYVSSQDVNSFDVKTVVVSNPVTAIDTRFVAYVSNRG